MRDETANAPAIHPAADVFPPMDDTRLRELADDIRANGLQVPITLHGGLVVDGRNRLRACEIAGVAPRFVEAPAAASPWQVAWTLNGQRRDLNDAQRYMLWKDISAHDADWQAEQKRIRREANKARAEAVATRARREDGTLTPKTSSACGKSTSTGSPPAPSRKAAANAAGVTESTVAMADALEGKRPDLAAQVRAGEVTLSRAYTQAKREEKVAALEDVAAQETKAVAGVYDVIVIDPPWPMQKIERETRPNQAAFDYPTMSEADLAALPIPAADNCHVWLWTTHRFMPMAFRLLNAWQMKYVCAFVWHKPGGFQPIGLPQYNCEFALYARKGSPVFLDTKAFPACFEAPRGSHSEKPEEFYDVLRRVTGGRRLDMFNRRKIDGFDGWGKESE